MVQQTRRVVENYIFHKLQISFSPDSYIASGVDSRNKQEINKIFKNLSLPHANSAIDVTVQELASQFEKQYKDSFPDLLEELRNANTSIDAVDNALSKITKDLFQLPLKPLKSRDAENGNIDSLKCNNLDDAHIKWGHIVAVLALAGILAVRAVECHSTGTPDHIVSWVTNFFDTEISQWITKQGGWESLVDWKSGKKKSELSKEEFDPSSFTSGIRSVVSVGVLAACVGFGALMMVKK